MEARFVYITCKDRSQALQIGRALVAERIIACANILDNMTSVYWWEGKVVEDQETVLVAKTTLDQIEALTTKVTELHSYDIPCVVTMPILEGNPAYIDWIYKETT